jgi:ATP-binding cassette subfamily B protein
VATDSPYHFVVIYRIGKDRVWVGDPDPLVGKTTYTLDEFNEMWTGYLVLVSRGENFRKGVESPGPFQRFLPTLKPLWGPSST